MINSIQFPSSVRDVVIFDFLVLSVISAAYAISNLVNIYFFLGRFRHAITASEIIKYRSDLEKYYIESSAKDGRELALRKSENYLLESLASAAAHNTKINDERARLLYNSNFEILVAYLCLGVAVIATISI